MTVTTTQDAIKAATSIARDIADGKLTPNALERQVVAELSKLALEPAEPGTEMAALRIEIARRVLAEGGISACEVAEWLAVQRRRDNPDGDQDGQGGAESADGADVLTQVSSDASVAHSGERGTEPYDADLELVEVPALAAESEPEPENPFGRNRRILARGRGLPVDPGLRPL